MGRSPGAEKPAIKSMRRWLFCRLLRLHGGATKKHKEKSGDKKTTWRQVVFH
ncbi:hypothetical protein TGS27_0895 [Geobacillus stearothermophilus]|nr:hypothetical protein TGS27_0895 [Geobacillus stearothermophilus]